MESSGDGKYQKYFLAAAIALVAFGAIASALLYFKAPWPSTTGKEKAHEILFSFFVTTVIVGGFGIFWKVAQDVRADRRAAHEKGLAERRALHETKLADERAKHERSLEMLRLRRREIERQFDSVVSCYNSMKRIRREARLLLREQEDGSLQCSDEVFFKVYSDLNAEQLRMEHFKRFFKTFPDFLEQEEATALGASFKKIEQKLRLACKEMERTPSVNGTRTLGNESRVKSLIVGGKGPLEEWSKEDLFAETDNLYALFNHLLTS